MPQGPLAVATTVAPIAYKAPGKVTVATSSTQIVTAGEFATKLTLQTAPGSAGNVWLNYSGGAAVVGTGTFVPAGGGQFVFGTTAAPMPTAAINGISDNGTVSVSFAGS